MAHTHYQRSNCSIARSLQVLGEKWTLLVLREAFYGSTRFEQFHDLLRCPRTVLADRLRTLVEEGILERVEYREPGRRARSEYRVTTEGHELMPILLALQQWGDRHKADPAGPPVIARHAGCGSELHVALACTEGHLIADPAEVDLVEGPGALPPVPA